jgi:hypothetical protein
MLTAMMRTRALLWLLSCLVASVTLAAETPLSADSLAVRAADGGTIPFADLLGADGRAAALSTQIMVATIATILVLRWQERAALGRNRAVR